MSFFEDDKLSTDREELDSENFKSVEVGNFSLHAVHGITFHLGIMIGRTSISVDRQR